VRAFLLLLFVVQLVAAAQKPLSQTSDQTGAVTPISATTSIASAITAMGTLPADCVATGKATLRRGSTAEVGTIRITTLGTKYSSEVIQTKSGTQTFVYADGEAADNLNLGKVARSLELGATSHSTYFPLALLTAVSTNVDTRAESFADDKIADADAYHVRVTNAYSETPLLKPLTKGSARDIWIDKKSGIVQRVAFNRRTASGAIDSIRVQIDYSDYRKIDGVLFPFHIAKKLNGMPWIDVEIEQVRFNTGLSASDFSIK